MKCSNSNISLTKIANLEKNPKKLHALPVTFCLFVFNKSSWAMSSYEQWQLHWYVLFSRVYQKLSPPGKESLKTQKNWTALTVNSLPHFQVCETSVKFFKVDNNLDFKLIRYYSYLFIYNKKYYVIEWVLKENRIV